MEEYVAPHSLSSRFRKACEECRRRKLKCDGREPCRSCASRFSPCVFGKVRRRTTRPPHPDEPIQSQIHLNVGTFLEPFHVTHRSSPGEEIICDAFFGPSSNISLLLNLYHLLPSPLIDGNQSEKDDYASANNCLDIFRYRRLVFPKSQDDFNSVSQDTPLNLGLLPFSLAEQFLRNYTSTLLYMLPFQTAACLECWLNEIYCPGTANKSSSAQHAVLFAALSIGTTFTEYNHWGERLFQQAKLLVSEISGSLPSIPAIQAIVLMILYAQYEWQIGRLNSAYLLLGDATRQSFAAGLQRASFTNGRNILRDGNMARTTYLSLYCYESYVCTSLGRPSSFSEAHVKDATAYDEDPVLASLIRFAQVMNELERVQNSDEFTVHALLQSSEKARQTLTKLSDALHDVSSGPGGIPEDEARQDTYYLLLILYHYAILIAHRPFLALLDKKKAHFNSIKSQYGVIDFGAILNSTWLSAGVEKAVSSAKMIISYLGDACKSGSRVKDSSNTFSFVESACLALAYHCLLDKNASSTNASFIHAGINTLRNIACKNVVSDRLLAMETVLRMIGFHGTIL